MIARVLLVIALAAPAAAQSPQVCPWLNAGTAAKILGSDVTASAHSGSNWSGSCRFVASADPAASIEITVGKTDTNPCSSGATPLTGIGNQAAMCVATASGRNVQTVSGRVRDVWFVVVLARAPEKSANQSQHSSPIHFLAEQVAGNLY